MHEVLPGIDFKQLQFNRRHQHGHYCGSVSGCGLIHLHFLTPGGMTSTVEDSNVIQRCLFFWSQSFVFYLTSTIVASVGACTVATALLRGFLYWIAASLIPSVCVRDATVYSQRRRDQGEVWPRTILSRTMCFIPIDNRAVDSSRSVSHHSHIIMSCPMFHLLLSLFCYVCQTGTRL